MSYKKVCDLCGKEIVTGDYREFKIKERRGWLESYWVKLDAHDECVRKLVDAVKTNPPTPKAVSVQEETT